MHLMRKAMAMTGIMVVALGTALVAGAPAHAASYPSCTTANWETNAYGDRIYLPEYPPDYYQPGACLLAYGMANKGVNALQTALNKCNGASLTVDGKFGANTKNAVIAVQRNTGISRDGVYGPDTSYVMGWPMYSSSGSYLGCKHWNVTP